MRHLSRFTRWLLVTLTLMAIVGIGAWAYTALTSEGTVTIDECLSWVGTNTFDVQLYPQGSDTRTLTLANASPDDIDVDLISTITPDLKGVTVSIPNKVTVPATGQASFDVVVNASKSAEPLVYQISILVER